MNLAQKSVEAFPKPSDAKIFESIVGSSKYVHEVLQNIFNEIFGQVIDLSCGTGSKISFITDKIQ